jgi:hypothetical protein
MSYSTELKKLWRAGALILLLLVVMVVALCAVSSLTAPTIPLEERFAFVKQARRVENLQAAYFSTLTDQQRGLLKQIEEQQAVLSQSRNRLQSQFCGNGWILDFGQDLDREPFCKKAEKPEKQKKP